MNTIITENYYTVQLNAAANQGLYIYSDASESIVQNTIQTIYNKYDYEEGFLSVKSVKDLFREYKKDTTA